MLEQEAEKVNQVHSRGPSKKSTVFEWICKKQWVDYIGSIQDAPSWAKDTPHQWVRQRVTKAQVADVWDEYAPSQRVYDSFRNEWHLHTLFDINAQAPDVNFFDYEDEDVVMSPVPIESAVSLGLGEVKKGNTTSCRAVSIHGSRGLGFDTKRTFCLYRLIS